MVEGLEKRNPEGRCLSRAGLGLPYHVPPQQEWRYRELLNREGSLISRRIDSLLDERVQLQFLEALHSLFTTAQYRCQRIRFVLLSLIRFDAVLRQKYRGDTRI